MLDYQALRILWWLLLGALLIGFAVMDGFDLGVGAIFRFIGRTDAERRVVLESIEPVWEGNQVWFIVGGGAVFAAWPLLYAASFSGLYLAMLLILAALILRPVGFFYRNRLQDPRWRSLWDGALLIGGAVPALLFGVAFGNLFLGLPFHYDALERPIYTGEFLGLLRPFALLAGLVSLSMLVMHGAVYAALKVGEPMAARAARAARIGALVYAVGFIGAGVWLAGGVTGQRIVSGASPFGPSDPLDKSVLVMPGAWLQNFAAHGVVPAVALAGALAAALLVRRRAGLAFIASALTQAGTILTGAVALFPFLMPSSTDPDEGLTVWNASSSAHTLNVMLIAVIVFLPLVIAYTAWVFHVLKGRISLSELGGHEDSY